MKSLVFNPADPFPLVTDVSYEDEKAHAVVVDQWLGFKADAIENLLALKEKETDREFWIGKSVQTFSTPYTELRSVLQDLKPEEKQIIVDLGTGYARLAHVMALHAPTCKFIGYEIVPERVAEALRVILERGPKNARLECHDASAIDFTKLGARTFFIYDFGSRPDVEKCLENLKLLAAETPITIVGRGGRSRDVIEKLHPWLSQVVTPLHRPHYSIYRSGESSDQVENK